MLCLLRSSDLFQNKATVIHHGETQGYYKKLLAGKSTGVLCDRRREDEVLALEDDAERIHEVRPALADCELPALAPIAAPHSEVEDVDSNSDAVDKEDSLQDPCETDVSLGTPDESCAEEPDARIGDGTETPRADSGAATPRGTETPRADSGAATPRGCGGKTPQAADIPRPESDADAPGEASGTGGGAAVSPRPASVAASFRDGDMASPRISRRGPGRHNPASLPNWGTFCLTYSVSEGFPYGRWMSRCLYHRKNSTTLCTRTYTCSGPEDFDTCRRLAKAWSLSALAYSRKRHHGRHLLVVGALLPEEVMDEQVERMVQPPSRGELLNDDELDELEGVPASPRPRRRRRKVARDSEDRAPIVVAAEPRAADADPVPSAPSVVAAEPRAADTDSVSSGPGPDEQGPNSSDAEGAACSHESDSSESSSDSSSSCSD